MRGKARDHSEVPGGSGDRIPRVSPTDPRQRHDILALETATPWCSVAVSHGGQVFSRHVPADQRHGEMALALVDEVLEGQLIKFVRVVRFERNDAEPVLERALRMLAGDAAGELVRDQKREPDTDLTEKIAPTTR